MPDLTGMLQLVPIDKYAMRYYELLEAFDPHDLEHSMASFLFVAGRFIPVHFQAHLDGLGKLAGVIVPSFGTDGTRMKVYDTLNAYAAQHGIVQGSFTPGSRHLKSSMGLVGTLADCRIAFKAFRAAYPDLLAQVDAISYDIIGLDGKRIDSDFIEGIKIDRKFGRRY